MYKNLLKFIFDFIISLIILIIFTPFLLIISLFLVGPNKGKIFFLQERPGHKAMPFKVIKFKTMNDKKDVQGKLLPNHLRTTKIGAILRKYSLDELPQLLNVIKGDMSLVGPRPLLFKYIPLYSDIQNRRHEVRPGITGWAQVNGRNKILWTKKFEFDVHYVDNISFIFDLKILWLTFLKVIKAEDVNANETITSEPFNGHN